MKGSFQIIRLFNIPVQIHWTFLLIFVWLGFTSYSQSWNWQATTWAFFFLIAIFICVVLHEFGHALTARRYGVDTRDIILSPIGGVARLDRLPEKPAQEFMVAIAGPLVNVAIGLILSAYALVASEESRMQLFDIFSLLTDQGSNFFAVELSAFEYFLFGLIALNIILAIFNMLPAFPMDGGRVLRSLLSMKLGRVKATRIATIIGQLIAVGLVGYGFFTMSLVTSFIGIFVFVSAANEYRMVRFDRILEKYKVQDVFRSNFTPLYTNDTIEKALQQLSSGLEKHFLVLNEWQQMTGVLSEKQLLKAAEEKDVTTPVSSIIKSSYKVYLPSDPLKDVFSDSQWAISPVYDQGRLVGVLDRQAVQNFLKIHQRVKKNPS